MTSPRVIVTDGGVAWGQSRPALGAVRGLAAGGYAPVVATSEKLSLAAASRHATAVFEVPSCREPGYVEAVRQVQEACDAPVVIPASDGALLALQPDVQPLTDKHLLAARARDMGFQVPQEYVLPDGDTLVASGPRMPYPVIVKPLIGKPVRRCDSSADLAVWAEAPGPLLVQPFLSGTLRAMTGIMDRGKLNAAHHQTDLRTWPAAGGASTAAISVEPDLALEEHAMQLLATYRGIFELQLIDDVLIDLNLRVYGSMPLALAAGLNLVALAADLELGRLGGNYTTLRRSAPGVFYRWLEADMRNALARWRLGRLSLLGAARQVRPRAGVAHGGPESLSDPAPMLARARYLLAAVRGDAGPAPSTPLRRSIAHAA